MANVNIEGGARALPKPPKRPPSALTGALANKLGTGAVTPVAGALAAKQAGAPGVQPPSTVDLSQDPILQQIQAANLAAVQNAQAAETAGTKQALTNYGFEPGMEGLFPDQATQDAAKGNPFSVLANLLYAHQQDTNQIDEGMNHQNLFYSSAHDTANQDEAHHYQEGRDTAYSGLRSQLSGLSAATLAAQNAAASSNAQGASDAYARYTPPTTAAPPPPGVATNTLDTSTLAKVLAAGRGHSGRPAGPRNDVQVGSRLGLRGR